MTPRRRAAFGLWAALTFSAAVLVHDAIHAAGSRSFVWDSPAHVVMFLTALGLLGGVAARLGVVGPARERRRRLALERAALGPVRPAVAVFGLGVQGGLAGLFFLAEGASLDPERIGLALLCGLLALLCSAFLFRATRDRVVALLVALVATVIPAPPAATRRRRTPRPLRATAPYRLFVPNRPPPIAA
jgi:hypothetical protein